MRGGPGVGLGDAMTTTPATALLVDFGGVLTGSLRAAFRRFGEEIGVDPELPQRLLSTDERARAALVEHECGRSDDEAFESAFAAVLAEHGADVSADGLIGRVFGRLGRDEAMIAEVARRRAGGVPTALVSNSLGRDAYAGFDLDAMFDVVVVSGRVGVRKPSRRIYTLACEELGVAPEACVLVDDTRVNLDGAARLGVAGVLHRNAATTIDELDRLLGPVAR